jgi:hypothetical protein
MDWTGLKVKKFTGSKTRGLFGSVKIHGNVDNTFKYECKIYVKQGGEYRLMPFKIPPQPVCDLFNNEDAFVQDFADVSNITQPMPCPMPKVKLIHRLSQPM